MLLYEMDCGKLARCVNRTTYAPAAGGGCQTSTGTTTSYSYDAADRLTPTDSHTGPVYDAYGRITTLPAADATAGVGNVSIGYYANDLLRTRTQNGTTLTYTLDVSGRLKAWTSNSTGVTKTNHYDDASSDSPDWVSESSDHTSWTRNITDLAGQIAARHLEIERIRSALRRAEELSTDVAGTIEAAAS